MSRFPLGFALSICLLLPAVPSEAARPGRVRVDTAGYRHLFFRADRGEHLVADSWSETVVLDSEEAIERHIRFVVELPSDLAAGEAIPVTVLDAAMGDICEADSEGEVVESPQDSGFGHLGQPKLCSFVPPAGRRTKGAVVEAHVVVARPRLPRLDHRFAMLLPVQPIGVRARQYELAVEYLQGFEPSVKPHSWGVELSRKALEAGRMRTFFQLQAVEALPLPAGIGTVSGRVPAVSVTSGEPWDALALDHRAFFDAAARSKGSVIPLAGRVYGQPDILSSVREAVRLALDTIELDPSGGRGGGWQLPQRASHTVDDGVGTAADRAALLVALLRTSEIRAEIVLANRSTHRVAPGEPLALLNQTLVFLPDVKLDEVGSPLFIDPSMSSSWLGTLDDALIGRDALMLGERGARWLRLSSAPPRRSWTLNAREDADGAFDLKIGGVLEGAPGARVRDWDAAGRPADAVPVDDLAWLASWWTELDLTLEELVGGRVAVSASGTLPRELVLVEGHMVVPAIPRAANPNATLTSWPYARDARRFDVDLLESWIFRGTRSGGAIPDGRRVTPFWDVDSLGSWSGSVFNRRTRLRFTGEVLPPAAAVEVDRFYAFLELTLGGVTAP